MLLLQERIPQTGLFHPHEAEVQGARATTGETETQLRILRKPGSARPEVQLLSNGRYHGMLTHAGGGYSRHRDMATTRWREDGTRDPQGTFCYLRDVESGQFWSTALQPTAVAMDQYEAIFSDAKVEFRGSRNGYESHLEIAISAEDDIELRRLRLSNRSRRTRTIEITTYAEVVLAPAISDEVHPAFSNLFVQTEIVRAKQALLCTRRPRAHDEVPPWMFHLIAVHDADITEISYETDRARFLGRGNTPRAPDALTGQAKLSDTDGSVLDPVVAIRCRIELAPGQTAMVDMVYGVGGDREACAGLVDKYRDRRLADRVFDLTGPTVRWCAGRSMPAKAEAQLYERLGRAGAVRQSAAARRPGSAAAEPARPVRTVGACDLRRPADRAAEDHRRGEHRAGPADGAGARVLAAQGAARGPGDLEREQERLSPAAAGPDPGHGLGRSGIQRAGPARRHLRAPGAADLAGRPGAAAGGGAGDRQRRARHLAAQVGRHAPPERALPAKLPESTAVPTVEPLASSDAGLPPPAGDAEDQHEGVHDPWPFLPLVTGTLFDNGLGAFAADGREYVVVSREGAPTPAPWSNVVANARLGTVVSESSPGYTWFENAHEFRLTPWHNDPVSDTGGEAFYLRDEETGRVWSPMPLPCRGRGAYRTRHGFGYTVHEHEEDGIASELWIYVAVEDAVKFSVLRLRNLSGRTRRLSATGYVEWVLGDLRSKSQMHVVCERDTGSGALFARNPYNTEFGGRVAFFDTDAGDCSWTADRTEFLGRNGSLAEPAALKRERLSGRLGVGLDPCAAIQVPIDLADGQSQETVFRLGAGRDYDEAQALARRVGGVGKAYDALDAVRIHWRVLLTTVQVSTPDPSVDALANGWLLYQTLGCRYVARSGYYQSGGAFGFRDQLQDSMATLHAIPALTREHLLLSAAHQFPQGDVMHWWHPPRGRGVRTRCSDDYLWLPLATCRYLEVTGDTGVPEEQVGFVEGRPVNPDEEGYYDLPVASRLRQSLYQHCVLALQRGCSLVGERGLPLIATGDWNDGMNRVGEANRGESVWLGFFLHEILQRFAEVATQRGDTAFADWCAGQSAQLRGNLESPRMGRGVVPAGLGSTMARRWAPPGATNAGSIRYRRAGRCCRAWPARSAPGRRSIRSIAISCARRPA